MKINQLKEVTLFLTTGTISYLIYTGGFIGLRLYMPDLAAISLSYGLAVVVHFVLSTRVVFRRRVRQGDSSLFVRYAALYLMSYSLSVTAALTAIYLGAAPVLATASGVAATTVFNYMLSRYWVFR